VHADCAIHELSREGGIPTTDSLVPQDLRQLKIGVGATGDRAQHGVGGETLRVWDTVALAGALRGSLPAPVLAPWPLSTLAVPLVTHR
jgi:hypothetical protein